LVQPRALLVAVVARAALMLADSQSLGNSPCNTKVNKHQGKKHQAHNNSAQGFNSAQNHITLGIVMGMRCKEGAVAAMLLQTVFKALHSLI
jgi:hypothetical protein